MGHKSLSEEVRLVGFAEFQQVCDIIKLREPP